jgi:hypothetical protein
MDTVNRVLGYGVGPRAALLIGAACYVVGAFLLRPVDERRREDTPPEPQRPPGAVVPGVA